MGISLKPLPVKLFIGMLSADAALFERCARLLADRYGALELESPVREWGRSDYYREEMGAPLFRKFISFRHAVDPAVLARVKQHTNDMEAAFALREGARVQRTINLDPGYVTEAKVVLATTKDFAHRVYIGDGIYAESTLLYRKEDRGFIAVDHTYPDFRTPEVRAWFLEVRQRLRTEIAGRAR
jgi:Domain of unknown function (DUF4416)